MRLKKMTYQQIADELRRTTATLQPDKLLQRLGFVGEYSWLKAKSTDRLPVAILTTGSGWAHSMVYLQYNSHSRKYFIASRSLDGKEAYKLLTLGLINHKELRQCLSVN